MSTPDETSLCLMVVGTQSDRSVTWHLHTIFLAAAHVMPQIQQASAMAVQKYAMRVQLLSGKLIHDAGAALLMETNMRPSTGTFPPPGSTSEDWQRCVCMTSQQLQQWDKMWLGCPQPQACQQAVPWWHTIWSA